MNARLTAVALLLLAGCSEQDCQPDRQSIVRHERELARQLSYLAGLRNPSVGWESPKRSRAAEIERIEAAVRREQVQLELSRNPCAASLAL